MSVRYALVKFERESEDWTAPEDLINGEVLCVFDNDYDVAGWILDPNEASADVGNQVFDVDGKLVVDQEGVER